MSDGDTTYIELCLSISATPCPFQCWAALISSVDTPTIWMNWTDPHGVAMGDSWASSTSNMCWRRESLLSRGLCQGTWSPTHNWFSGNVKQTLISHFKLFNQPFDDKLVRTWFEDVSGEGLEEGCRPRGRWRFASFTTKTESQLKTEPTDAVWTGKPKKTINIKIWQKF